MDLGAAYAPAVIRGGHRDGVRGGVGVAPLLCLPIRNTAIRAGGRDCAQPFALLTDTQRPLRIGKQSKAAREVAPPGCLVSVAYR